MSCFSKRLRAPVAHFIDRRISAGLLLVLGSLLLPATAHAISAWVGAPAAGRKMTTTAGLWRFFRAHFLPGLLLLMGGAWLPQVASAHPCQYIPESCPTPSTPPPPSASENPSLDGSYYVTAPPPSGYYFGLISGAGQYDQPRIDVSGQATGQYTYYAEYCLDAGSYI